MLYLIITDKYDIWCINLYSGFSEDVITKGSLSLYHYMEHKSIQFMLNIRSRSVGIFYIDLGRIFSVSTYLLLCFIYHLKYVYVQCMCTCIFVCTVHITYSTYYGSYLWSKDVIPHDVVNQNNSIHHDFSLSSSCQGLASSIPSDCCSWQPPSRRSHCSFESWKWYGHHLLST